MKIGYVTFVDMSKLRADAIHTSRLLTEFRRLGLDVTVLAGKTGRGRLKGRHLTFIAMVCRRLGMLGRIVARKNKHDLFYVRDWLFASLMSFFRLRYAFEINGLISYEGLIRQYYRRGSWAHGFFRRLERRVLNSARRIVAVSSGMKTYCVDQGIDAGKVLVAENAADLSVFHPDRPKAQLPAGEKGIVVGWMGSFESHHGFHDLLAIAGQLSERACRAVRFLIVGGGPHRDELEGQAAAQGLQEYFHFCGALRWDQVPEYMLNADLCLCLDNRAEANLEYRAVIGITQIKTYEYLALGKPVLAQDLGDAREVLEGQGVGWVCGCDPEDVAQKILEISRNPEQIAERGRNALAAARKRYNWAVTARKIVDFLGEPAAAAGTPSEE